MVFVTSVEHNWTDVVSSAFGDTEFLCLAQGLVECKSGLALLFLACLISTIEMLNEFTILEFLWQPSTSHRHRC